MCTNMKIFVFLLTVTISLAAVMRNLDENNDEHNYGEGGIELIMNVNSQRVKRSDVDSIPILSQLKSAGQAISGDLEGAKETQENFSKKFIGTSQVISVIQLANGDKEAALETQRQFLKHNAGVPLTALGTYVGGPVGGALATHVGKIINDALGSDEEKSMKSDEEESVKSEEETHDSPKSFDVGSVFDSVSKTIGNALLGAFSWI